MPEHLDDHKKLLNYASILEDKTREQALKTSRLPFISPHMVLMPDAHLGMGATVGSVIPTLGAIIPAAVGVDIGCLDAETEFLSPDGWVRISEWNGQQVMVYDPESDTGSFEAPHEFIDLPCDEFFHFKNSKGMDQMLSEEHRVLVFQGFKGRGYKHSVMQPGQLAGLSLGGAYYATKAAFRSGMSDLPGVSDEMIRLEVMIQADCRVRSSPSGNRAELHVRKERKIERARALLAAASIEFSENVEQSGSTRIAFTMPHGFGTKDLSRYWTASARQLAIVAEEALLWDGHVGYRSYYSSTDAGSADIVQYAFAATGVRAGISSMGKQEEHHNEVFAVTPTKNVMVGYCDPVMVPSPDGRKYCFVVGTGFFLARRHGHIFTTGNCGMIAVRTQLTKRDIDETSNHTPLSWLRRMVEADIPLSAGNYNTSLSPTAVAKVARLETRADTSYDFNPASFASNWAFQLGTLGSGNHFIELCLDELDRVWLFLHSGSRGVGNKIAQHHIKIARGLMEKYWIELEDPDLSYLVEGTPEFWDYIRQMSWAQEFALANRAEMMDRFIKQVEAWTGQMITREQEINCHHNYTQKERHFGKEVWLSRKGAIDASKGTWGLIPGSMGTASYVVQGRGNPVALNSAPHGAGREWSRRRARENFTKEQLDAAMEGIEWSGSSAFLDEIPGAYKPIDQVMMDAADLVEVKHKLRQIVSIKGD